MNRREFAVVAAAACAACCAVCGSGEVALADEPRQPTPPGALDKTPVDVGPKSDYLKEGIVDKFAKTKRILIITHEGKIYAPTATCSHKNAVVMLKGDPAELVCRAHGSKYSVQGTVTKGPAKVSLYRYGISVDDKGNLIVDRSKQFEEKKWDDPGASIAVA
jgi:cytochrome b6-f complex iron-sulfur subunit